MAHSHVLHHMCQYFLPGMDAAVKLEPADAGPNASPLPAGPQVAESSVSEAGTVTDLDAVAEM